MSENGEGAAATALVEGKEHSTLTRNSPLKVSSRNTRIRKKLHMTENETLLGDFSCSLSKKILYAGRLYITDKNVYFDSFFLPGSPIRLPVELLVQIKNKKSLGFIENSIGIAYREGEELRSLTFIGFWDRMKPRQLLRLILDSREASFNSFKSPSSLSKATVGSRDRTPQRFFLTRSNRHRNYIEKQRRAASDLGPEVRHRQEPSPSHSITLTRYPRAGSRFGRSSDGDVLLEETPGLGFSDPRQIVESNKNVRNEQGKLFIEMPFSHLTLQWEETREFILGTSAERYFEFCWSNNAVFGIYHALEMCSSRTCTYSKWESSSYQPGGRKREVICHGKPMLYFFARAFKTEHKYVYRDEFFANNDGFTITSSMKSKRLVSFSEWTIISEKKKERDNEEGNNTLSDKVNKLGRFKTLLPWNLPLRKKKTLTTEEKFRTRADCIRTPMGLFNTRLKLKFGVLILGSQNSSSNRARLLAKQAECIDCFLVEANEIFALSSTLGARDEFPGHIEQCKKGEASKAPKGETKKSKTRRFLKALILVLTVFVFLKNY